MDGGEGRGWYGGGGGGGGGGGTPEGLAVRTGRREGGARERG